MDIKEPFEAEEVANRIAVQKRIWLPGRRRRTKTVEFVALHDGRTFERYSATIPGHREDDIVENWEPSAYRDFDSFVKSAENNLWKKVKLG